MTHPNGKKYQVGDWLVEPDSGRIVRDGASAVLRAGLMDVLIYLAESAGMVVSNDDIMEGPWNGVIVSDSSVYRAISDLRKALGEGDQSQTYIETIPKRGYRLVALVVVVADGPAELEQNVPPQSPAAAPVAAPLEASHSRPEASGSPRRRAAFTVLGILVLALASYLIATFAFPLMTASRDGAAAPQASIAVLPFVNLSQDPGDEYFSDGISEQILNLLGQTKNLHVAARTSSFAFKDQTLDVRDIAARLNVATILEGNIRRNGKSLHVSAQLIDAETGYNLWSNSFDREIADIFVVQDQLTREIISALRDHFKIEDLQLPESRKTQIEVFNAYLLGQHYYKQQNKNALTKSLAYFDQAISLDPTYAPAFVGKANTYMLLSEQGYGNIPKQDALLGADILINEALALDPTLVAASVSRGQLLRGLSRNTEALIEFERAIRLDPSLASAHLWRGQVLLQRLEIQQATEAFIEAQTLDPLAMAPFINVIQAFNLVGDSDKAEELMAQFQKLAPGEPGTFAMTDIGITTGQLAAAYQGAERAIEVNSLERYQQELSIMLFELRELDRAQALAPPRSSLYISAYLDPDGARGNYHDLLAGQKVQSDYLFQIALAEFMSQNYAAARRYYEDAIEGNEAIDGLLFELPPERMLAPYLAFARQQVGDISRADPLIASIETALERLKNEGATARHLVLEARLNILRGERDAAMRALRQAHNTQHLGWYVLQEPFFKSLRQRDDFKALVLEVDSHIDTERAKLGWDPIEP